MLKEYDLLPGPKQMFWNMDKESIYYVGGNKSGPCPKGCRGKVVQVINCKIGGSTERVHHFIVLRRMD